MSVVDIADKARTDERVLDEAKLLLEQAEDAIGVIEYWAAEVNDYMVELSGLDDLPEDVESLADDLGYEARDLADSLNAQLERLRKAIAAWAADDNTDETD